MGVDARDEEVDTDALEEGADGKCTRLEVSAL